MNQIKRLMFALVSLAAVALAGGVGARGEAKLKAVAQAPAKIAVGKPFYLVLNLEVAAGYHIGGADAGKNQIPTTVKVQAPAGFKVGSPLFPPSREESFFGEKQRIYDGKVTVRIPVTASKPGKGVITTTIEYQACNDKLCDPPDTVTAEASVNVTGAMVKRKSGHK